MNAKNCGNGPEKRIKGNAQNLDCYGEICSNYVIYQLPSYGTLYPLALIIYADLPNNPTYCMYCRSVFSVGLHYISWLAGQHRRSMPLSFNIDIKPSYFSKLEPLEVHKLLDMDWKMLSLIIHTVSLINPSVLPVDWLYQKEAIIISFLNIMKPINVNVNHSHVIYVTKIVDGSLNWWYTRKAIRIRLILKNLFSSVTFAWHHIIIWKTWSAMKNNILKSKSMMLSPKNKEARK